MIDSGRMAAVDANAAALGVPQKQLMESSGNAVAHEVRDVADLGARVAIVAGRGNNGGDAFVAARFLDDYEVSVHLLGRRETITTDIARENWDALIEGEYDAREVIDSRTFDLPEADVVIDALLGTGISGPAREPEATAIRAINDADATVVSVDVPSGLDADTGEAAGEAVRADRVVTFHDEKPGLADLDATVSVADIGIPAAAEIFVGPGDLQTLTRESESHKGDFGRVFVIGGGPYTGADLAYVAAPETVAREIQGYSENLIVESYPGERLTPDQVDGLLASAQERDVVVLGPGLGDAEETLQAVREFLVGFEGRAVIDADALQVVPEVETDATLVCTPHQGELREMGGPASDDWEERADLVSDFADELGHTLLVKGVYDVISDGETTRANRTGNPGMTVGGTGDVLAGVTAALLAVHEPLTAAAIGAYANGHAGDLVVEEGGYGMVATDLLPAVRTALWGEHR